MDVKLGGGLELEAKQNWLLDKVGGGAPRRSAARSLHVAGQSRRHEEHLGENDHVADVDDQLKRVTR